MFTVAHFHSESLKQYFKRKTIKRMHCQQTCYFHGYFTVWKGRSTMTPAIRCSREGCVIISVCNYFWLYLSQSVLTTCTLHRPLKVKDNSIQNSYEVNSRTELVINDEPQQHSFLPYTCSENLMLIVQARESDETKMRIPILMERAKDQLQLAYMPPPLWVSRPRPRVRFTVLQL